MMRRAAAAAGLVLTALAWFAAAAPALAAPAFPPLDGRRVVDEAGILSPQTEASLTQTLQSLETQTTRQLVVVTLPTLGGETIEDYGYQLGRAWGIGQARSEDSRREADNGVLFIVAPNDRVVRIEVGYGLEPVLTDALSSVIINSAVIPRFKVGDLEGGVTAGTNAIVQQLRLPDDQARLQVAQAAQAARQSDAPGLSLLHILVVLFILFVVFGGLGRGRRAGILPWIVLGGLGGGGRGGGWSSGGGGFSGGGGSFGGGGASGRW